MLPHALVLLSQSSTFLCRTKKGSPAPTAVNSSMSGCRDLRIPTGSGHGQLCRHALPRSSATTCMNTAPLLRALGPEACSKTASSRWTRGARLSPAVNDHPRQLHREHVDPLDKLAPLSCSGGPVAHPQRASLLFSWKIPRKSLAKHAETTGSSLTAYLACRSDDGQQPQRPVSKRRHNNMAQIL